jgi:predicted nucleic acid-binding protein
MPRKILSTTRRIASNRKPVINRKSIKRPPNDNKLKVVLDTGILIAVLISQKKGHKDSANYRIIEEIKKDKFYVMLNSDLLAQYAKKLREKADENKLERKGILPILNLMREKAYLGRKFVDKPIKTKNWHDDLLFDGLNWEADYFVTKDMKLKKYLDKFYPEKFRYKKMVKSGKFLHKILKIN